MKLCFSLWNVFLPYMNKQWDFFSSVLDRKDFLMRSFNSAVTEPVEDSSLSQQVLWHFGRFFFFYVWNNAASIGLEIVLHSYGISALENFS